MLSDLEAGLYERTPLRVRGLAGGGRQVHIQQGGVALAGRLREEVEAGAAAGLPEGKAARGPQAAVREVGAHIPHRLNRVRLLSRHSNKQAIASLE